MEIRTLFDEVPYEFALEGRLDTNTAPQLEDFVGDLYAQAVSDIVVDMKKCDFVSSAGLRVIVAMQKRASSSNGSLVFRHVQDEVMDVFQMTGFDKILTFV
ncbi:MAG: hypothetical protein BZ138_06220 [Methanosphaera sp. rholeuAM270]|nr:MAG: hypothetical protein BZ138_06220 [Methanosphaera sp. rholeuAM270]